MLQKYYFFRKVAFPLKFFSTASRIYNYGSKLKKICTFAPLKL